ncbi:hypothetical protein BDA96_01G535200 [Sorghum bicolor]|uniref:Uncharacterized protein n=2 Tax=Sorghum bicolor TaxID=4558 RepID=A0A921S651_SORBI|nr:hypothetical protein BDA96_01G535200 [Sorghum bicolor]KXG40159.1 hypothetical protein SORBI_3001G501500 [Sorghum bicolor]
MNHRCPAHPCPSRPMSRPLRAPTATSSSSTCHVVVCGRAQPPRHALGVGGRVQSVVRPVPETAVRSFSAMAARSAPMRIPSCPVRRWRWVHAGAWSSAPVLSPSHPPSSSSAACSWFRMNRRVEMYSTRKHSEADMDLNWADRTDMVAEKLLGRLKFWLFIDRYRYD